MDSTGNEKWRVEIAERAQRQLRKLDPQIRKRIVDFLFDRVAILDDPRSIGEALHGDKLGDYWKYRVGDYRVIAEIRDEVLIIIVLEIVLELGHRREVYR